MRTKHAPWIIGKLRNRWRHMVGRCTDPRRSDYPRYGGRGIRVCVEWLDPDTGFDAFAEFVASELPRPDGMSLEQLLRRRGSAGFQMHRPDNDGHYGPQNLAWATPQEQSDAKPGTQWIEVNGELRTRPAAARLSGIDPRTASRRQRMGYNGDEAVSLPIGGRTSEARESRDAVLLALIRDRLLVVDGEGFVFWRGRDGLQPVVVAPVSDGRYLGISLTIPAQYHCLIPAEDLARRLRSGGYRDGFAHHRVVALWHHVLPPGNGYVEVHHGNGDTHDNRPENLCWLEPDAHRRAQQDGPSATPGPSVDYRDRDARDRAWKAILQAERGRKASAGRASGPALPINVEDAVVAEVLTAVLTDPAHEASIWNQEEFRSILRAVVCARGNRLAWLGSQPTIICTDQTGARSLHVPLVALASSHRVYFGCEACGRQSLPVRSEIRNRCTSRYGPARCESCRAIDRAYPALASLLAPDPSTGVQPSPSTITVGTKRKVAFHCRVPGCPVILMRRPKSLFQAKTLPVCEGHRGRGNSFAATPAPSGAPGEADE